MRFRHHPHQLPPRTNLSVKGKWQQKFLLSHLKETLKVMYKRLLQNFYICFTLGDIVT